MDWLAQIGILVYILTFFRASGKFIEGTLVTDDKWAFLTRFCFLSDAGKLEFEFTYPKTYEPQKILLYYDESDQWPAVYKSNKTCKQKMSPPHIKPENNQIIVLDRKHYWSGCNVQKTSNITDGLDMLACSASRTFKSKRERWWFVALSRCVNSSEGLNLHYKMWLTNGHETMFKHFSADEFYILQVDIAFLIIQFIMMCSAAVVGHQLKEKQLFHSTYKMYIVAVSFEVGHLLFVTIGYGIYASNGIESRLSSFRTFGRILEAVSLMTFLLMLILMAKGFTITRGRISNSGSIKIAIFMTLYVICYAVLFIYESIFFDPGEVLYLYESPAGYGLIALRLIAWVWFCYGVFFTLKHYPEKSKFYFPFLAFYTIWYWAGPVVIISAMKLVPLWVREKTVNAVEISVTLVGYLFFAILTRPSAANKNFPYHVRTSQIGVMDNNGQNGVPASASKDLDSFPSHTYAPGQDMSAVINGAPNFTDLFTVSNTRNNPTELAEIFGHEILDESEIQMTDFLLAHGPH